MNDPANPVAGDTLYLPTSGQPYRVLGADAEQVRVRLENGRTATWTRVEVAKHSATPTKRRHHEV